MKLSPAEIRSQRRIKVTNEQTLLSLSLQAGGGALLLPGVTAVKEQVRGGGAARLPETPCP